MTPLPYTWTGEAFEPLPRFAKRADAEYVVGQVYVMAPVEERSMKSHRQFFAAVNEAWKNLPESYGDRFPTAEHLRKWCLIRCGYRDERTLVAASKAEAVRIAAFVRPSDEYAVVTVREAVVTIYTAKSQSTKAMGKKVFQESKQAVLDTLDAMLSVEPGSLARECAE